MQTSGRFRVSQQPYPTLKDGDRCLLRRLRVRRVDHRPVARGDGVGRASEPAADAPKEGLVGRLLWPINPQDMSTRYLEDLPWKSRRSRSKPRSSFEASQGIMDVPQEIRSIQGTWIRILLYQVRRNHSRNRVTKVPIALSFEEPNNFFGHKRHPRRDQI